MEELVEQQAEDQLEAQEQLDPLEVLVVPAVLAPMVVRGELGELEVLR